MILSTALHLHFRQCLVYLLHIHETDGARISALHSECCRHSRRYLHAVGCIFVLLLDVVIVDVHVHVIVIIIIVNIHSCGCVLLAPCRHDRLLVILVTHTTRLLPVLY